MLPHSEDLSDLVSEIKRRHFDNDFSWQLRLAELRRRRRLRGGSTCDTGLVGIFNGLFRRGRERSMDGLASATLVDASSILRRWYLSTALSTNFQMISAIGIMSPMIDSTDCMIMFARDLVWMRLRISASDTVGALPDRHASPWACSKTLNIADLRTLFELK